MQVGPHALFIQSFEEVAVVADVGFDCHVVELGQECVDHLNVGLHASRVK